jgi:uncharacterized phage protein (TIGR02220 family)
MSKDPAFLFYSQDFVVGTMTMSFEDKGKYITLLCMMHQNGRLSEETIRLLVGNVSVLLKKKFKIDENGLWYNERLEKEIYKRQRFVDSRRENGKLGGRSKKASGKPNAKPNAKPTGLAKKNLAENENENENINENVYKKFLIRFNFLTGKKLRILDKKSKTQLKERLKEGYTMKEIESAIINCKNDKFHIENPKYLTPEFITRPDKLQKFIESNICKEVIENNSLDNFDWKKRRSDNGI